MERWSGKQLKHSAIYGIRVYRRGSMLHNHVDRSDTHIISAIVNVAQQVRCVLLYGLILMRTGTQLHTNDVSNCFHPNSISQTRSEPLSGNCFQANCACRKDLKRLTFAGYHRVLLFEEGLHHPMHCGSTLAPALRGKCTCSSWPPKPQPRFT